MIHFRLHLSILIENIILPNELVRESIQKCENPTNCDQNASHPIRPLNTSIGLKRGDKIKLIQQCWLQNGLASICMRVRGVYKQSTSRFRLANQWQCHQKVKLTFVNVTI